MKVEKGVVFKTNRCGEVVVVEYTNSRQVEVKFLDTGTTRVTRVDVLKKGNLEDPYVPRKIGGSFIGIGPYKKTTHKKHYQLWTGVLSRSCSERFKLIRPSYENVSVSEEWRNFQEFADWCENQQGFNCGWDLDKDLLSPYEGKLYSPTTCCFLPPHINNALQISSPEHTLPGISVRGKAYRVSYGKGSERQCRTFKDEVDAFLWYCQVKDSKIHSLAEEYKALLDERAYYALSNFSTLERAYIS